MNSPLTMPSIRQRELDRFDPSLPLHQASTPPASWYLEPEFLNWERRAVFAANWQPVGRLEQLAGAGDTICGRWVDEPYLVTRDEQHVLRAFYNVCRHHAAELVQDDGRRQELVCPYHAWTYALDGRLRKAPRLGRSEAFDLNAMGLRPIHVETWGRWALLQLNGAPRPLSASLAELDARLQATGFEELKFIARREYTIHCNWKVFVDNYLDGGYHVQSVHPGLAGQLEMDDYQTEVFDRFSIQSCSSGKKDGEIQSGDSAARIGEGAIYAWVYPNWMINRYGPWMDTNWVVPLAADRTLVVFDYFVEAELAGDEQFVNHSLNASHQVQQEDAAICESVQRGLSSAAYDCGRYAAPEAGEHHFHRLLHQDLSELA